MASDQSLDEIMQTYFRDDRPRINPEVCVNMLRVFYRFGRGNDPHIKKTEDWADQCLKNRACLYGNRVYTTPESFSTSQLSCTWNVVRMEWKTGSISSGRHSSSISTFPQTRYPLRCVSQLVK